MSKISIDTLAACLARYKMMSLKEKELEYDVIYKCQPNLLASVLVLNQMGRLYEELEVLLEILLVSHLALIADKNKIETVTEELQERELKRYISHVNFLDDLSPADSDRGLADYLNNHREKPLMAYVFNRVQEAGFLELKDEESKYLVLCGINLVNCIAAAKLV